MFCSVFRFYVPVLCSAPASYLIPAVKKTVEIPYFFNGLLQHFSGITDFPGIIKAMLKNYWKIAWRMMLKDRSFTLLNLTGLSAGLACALLIGLWVLDELQTDKCFARDKRLFQVIQLAPQGDGGIFTTDHTPGPLAGALVQEMPEVEEAASVVYHPSVDKSLGVAGAGEVHIKAREIFASAGFFSLFSYPLLQGNKDQVLSGRYNVVLSKEMALKLFHRVDGILGRTVEWDRAGLWSGHTSGTYVVSGIFEIPVNASQQFDMVFSYEAYFEKNSKYLDNWGSSNPSTYLVLKSGADPVGFNVKLKDFMRKKWTAANGTKDLKWIGTLYAQRYSDRYLYDRWENGIPVGGRIRYVRLFALIALFILVIACINFMNLSTAKAAGRIREVGIRKVVGARRGSLVLQYLGESILMAFLSLLLAIGLSWLLLPAFRQLTGKELSLFPDIRLIAGIAVLTLATGIIAGSYPAFYLSGFRPIAVLKGKFSSSIASLLVRKGLVVFQFTLSVILIASVWVVHRQMDLIRTKDLGYTRDHVIQFAGEGNVLKNTASFLEGLRKIPGVIDASNVNGDMMGSHSGGGGLLWKGKDPNTNIEFSTLYVDYGFVEVMGLHMVDGHAFSPRMPTDSTGIILNESAVTAMHLKNPVGQPAMLWGERKTIIGVVRDFNFESLYTKIGPLFLSYLPNNGNIVVKIGGSAEGRTLARIGEFYRQYNLGLPFEYKFLDADYQTLYASERRLSVLSRWFAGMAILISCLGLFGLAAFTAQRRQKEIGIRKVIGATVANIVFMLSGDFLRLVLLSLLIAFPLSWWLMTRWLNSFAYRTSVSVDVFLFAGGSILLMTLLSVSFQSIRAAIVNPVESLRRE